MTAIEVARALEVDLAFREDRAFVFTLAMARAVDVDVRVCAAPPEGTEASPVRLWVDKPVLWARPGLVSWNQQLTLDRCRAFRLSLRFAPGDRAVPHPFALMLHDVGHAARHEPVLRSSGPMADTAPTATGLASEEVATRWARIAANDLWGRRSFEARHIQRFDASVSYYLPPRGLRMSPTPRPTLVQLALARDYYTEMLAALDANTSPRAIVPAFESHYP